MVPALAQKYSAPADLYNAATIPDSLKENANAVVRYFNSSVVVKAPGKAVIKEHTIVTVLNEKEEHAAVMILGYDKKFSEVGSAEMMVYDAAGKLIKRYKKSDMYDRSATDGFSLITDNRILSVGHTIASYPITIEKITEQSRNSYLDLGEWDIQDEEMAVQQAIYTISVNPSIGFRYVLKNTNLSPKKVSVDGMDVYSWEVKNLKAVKPEEDCPSWRVLPKVRFAANNVELYNIPADMSSWKGFGLLMQTMNKDASILSAKREEEIRSMVSGLKSDKEKARFLYEYLQKSMRYVSIQLGVGGFKPFPASFVDEKKYGDCKALSNYMLTLLKTVGIPSYYAVINAGTNAEPADPDFVNDPFNHIILCVPFKNDTTWLECTSATSPFGKLGSFTENRRALLVTENGGVLVNTPRSDLKDNVFDSEAVVSIGSDGIAKAKVNIKGAGGYRDMFIGASGSKTDEQKKFFMDFLKLRQPDFFEINYLSDKDETKELELDLEYEKLSDVTAGNKFFYRPRLFDLWQSTLPVMKQRKTDFYFEYPMLKKNNTRISLPADMEVEVLPPDVKYTFSFGNFETKYSYDKDKNEIKSTSRFELNNHVIPANKYAEMQEFMENVSKYMSKKMVLRKKA